MKIGTEMTTMSRRRDMPGSHFRFLSFRGWFSVCISLLFICFISRWIMIQGASKGLLDKEFGTWTGSERNKWALVWSRRV